MLRRQLSARHRRRELRQHSRPRRNVASRPFCRRHEGMQKCALRRTRMLLPLILQLRAREEIKTVMQRRFTALAA